MSEMKKFDESMSVRGAWSRLTTNANGHGEWIGGEVGTPHGFVSVYHEAERPFTRFDFIWDGRLYMRNLSGKRYTKAGLVRMAAAFAREVVTA